MQIAERFSNHVSTHDLPSSAQVLALLAAGGADDATVQQAAEERITERFSNHKSTYDLPSSAQVLALLAAGGADDADSRAVFKWELEFPFTILGSGVGFAGCWWC